MKKVILLFTVFALTLASCDTYEDANEISMIQDTVNELSSSSLTAKNSSNPDEYYQFTPYSPGGFHISGTGSYNGVQELAFSSDDFLGSIQGHANTTHYIFRKATDNTRDIEVYEVIVEGLEVQSIYAWNTQFIDTDNDGVTDELLFRTLEVGYELDYSNGETDSEYGSINVTQSTAEIITYGDNTYHDSPSFDLFTLTFTYGPLDGKALTQINGDHAISINSLQSHFVDIAPSSNLLGTIEGDNENNINYVFKLEDGHYAVVERNPFNDIIVSVTAWTGFDTPYVVVLNDLNITYTPKYPGFPSSNVTFDVISFQGNVKIDCNGCPSDGATELTEIVLDIDRNLPIYALDDIDGEFNVNITHHTDGFPYGDFTADKIIGSTLVEEGHVNYFFDAGNHKVYEVQVELNGHTGYLSTNVNYGKPIVTNVRLVRILQEGSNIIIPVVYYDAELKDASNHTIYNGEQIIYLDNALYECGNYAPCAVENIVGPQDIDVRITGVPFTTPPPPPIPAR